MDIHSLVDALQGYHSADLATSTHKTYRAAERKHVVFCEKFGVKPLPSMKTTYAICNLAWTGGFTTLYNLHIPFRGMSNSNSSHFPDPKFDNMPKILPDITRSQDCCGTVKAFKMYVSTQEKLASSVYYHGFPCKTSRWL